MGKSKSKTFEKQSDLGTLMDFIVDFVVGTIETEDLQITHNGAEPWLDVITETSHKYRVQITITKVEENG